MSDLIFADWTVDINEDNTGVIVEFSHIGLEGVESFITAIPPDIALLFAEAVKEKAQEILQC